MIKNMKRDIKEALIVTIIICTGLTSCDNEFDPTKIDTPMAKGELVSDDIRMKIELNLDTTVFFIDNMDDINALLEKVSQAKAFELEHKGWKKAKANTHNVSTRATVKDYTIYEATSYPIANSQFKAKFSTSIVNEINAVTGSELDISSNKTYICEWRYIEPFVNLGPSDIVAQLESPLCGLRPSKRNGYSARGYESYTNSSGTQFLMLTNLLTILYEDVNHTTTYLSIKYPFFFNHKGYEFNYSILTLD